MVSITSGHQNVLLSWQPGTEPPHLTVSTAGCATFPALLSVDPAHMGNWPVTTVPQLQGMQSLIPSPACDKFEHSDEMSYLSSNPGLQLAHCTCASKISRLCHGSDTQTLVISILCPYTIWEEHSLQTLQQDHPSPGGRSPLQLNSFTAGLLRTAPQQESVVT